MSKPRLITTLSSFIAQANPKELNPTDLPFVKDKGKGKKERRSYWEVDHKNDRRTQEIMGATYAADFIQYMMMKPERGGEYLFRSVMQAAAKDHKSYFFSQSFINLILKLAVYGAFAKASGIQVDTNWGEEGG